MSSEHSHVSAFIHETGPTDIPAEVMHQARRCLLDLIGVAAAGTGTELSRILRDHAHRQAGAPVGASPLWFDGRGAGSAYAALANAGTIDAMDSHDGHRLVKGHAGVAVLPAALALMPGIRGRTVADLLTALIVGYELSLRAGIALHRTSAEYYSSGAWNAIGAAAVAARVLGLDTQATLHALGTAEHSAPRGTMMRVIDHPTMVKDSSAWGAQAGVAAAVLAADGFTGAPAELMRGTGENQDLGMRWRIREMYFKPYPVCRWAQPAVQASLFLLAGNMICPQQIQDIEVTTFDAAARLHTAAPETTEEAQYSLPFAVASALVHGGLTPENILDPQKEKSALHLAQKVRTTSSARMTKEFPARRLASVRITLNDGQVHSSEPTEADGDPEAPLDDRTLLDKFRHNARGLDHGRMDSIAGLVLSGWHEKVDGLTELLAAPIPAGTGSIT